MKGTKLIQRRRGVSLSTQHLLQASATDWQGVLICIYLIKMMHNSFPKQEKTHAFGNPFTHFLLSALLFESLRNGAGDFFDPACGESLCGFIRSPPGVYLFIFPNNRLLRLLQHYCRMVLKCWGRRSRGSVEVNEGSRVWRSFCFYHLTISKATQGNCSVTEGDEKSRAMDVFCERRNVDTKEMSSTGRNFALPFYL